MAREEEEEESPQVPALSSRAPSLRTTNRFPEYRSAYYEAGQPADLAREALFRGCFQGDIEVVRNALSAREAHGPQRAVNVNQAGPQGRTPLHLAAGLQDPRKAVEIVKLLLNRGACVNVRDLHSRTPLHYAAMNRANKGDGVFAARLLLAFKAEGKPIDREGKSPLDYAGPDAEELSHLLGNNDYGSDLAPPRISRDVLRRWGTDGVGVASLWSAKSSRATYGTDLRPPRIRG